MIFYHPTSPQSPFSLPSPLSFQKHSSPPSCFTLISITKVFLYSPLIPVPCFLVPRVFPTNLLMTVLTFISNEKVDEELAFSSNSYIAASSCWSWFAELFLCNFCSTTRWKAPSREMLSNEQVQFQYNLFYNILAFVWSLHLHFAVFYSILYFSSFIFLRVPCGIFLVYLNF